jgi:hypothetical protein
MGEVEPGARGPSGAFGAVALAMRFDTAALVVAVARERRTWPSTRSWRVGSRPRPFER